MKVIVAGSRTITDYETVKIAIENAIVQGINITSIVSGRAKGVDTLGERYAKEHGLPIHLYPAEWDKYGKRAGFMRNLEMAEVADGLVAIWDGKSPGTQNTIFTMRRMGKRVYVMELDLDGS